MFTLSIDRSMHIYVCIYISCVNMKYTVLSCSSSCSVSTCIFVYYTCGIFSFEGEDDDGEEEAGAGEKKNRLFTLPLQSVCVSTLR